MRKLRKHLGVVCETGGFVVKWQDFDTAEDAQTFVTLETQRIDKVLIGYVYELRNIAVPQVAAVQWREPDQALLPSTALPPALPAPKP